MSDRSPFEFDLATSVAPTTEPGLFDVEIDAGFTVGPKPNGGYLLALAARAAVTTLSAAGTVHPDPLASTAHYLAAPDPGPAQVAVTVLRAGRTASQVHATLSQGGRACMDATFTLGTAVDASTPPWWTGRVPLQLAPFDRCVRLPSSREGAAFTVSIMDRTDLRLDPADLDFARGEVSGRAELRGWISFADGRPIDPVGLVFLVDAFPPASFNLVNAGWVPTLSLTAYVRARPAPGPLRMVQRAQVVGGGLLDEVCEAWDSSGRLVAQATQLASIRFPDGTPAPTPQPPMGG